MNESIVLLITEEWKVADLIGLILLAVGMTSSILWTNEDSPIKDQLLGEGVLYRTAHNHIRLLKKSSYTVVCWGDVTMIWTNGSHRHISFPYSSKEKVSLFGINL